MDVQVATPVRFGEIPAAAAGILIWLYFAIAQGSRAAIVTLPILPIALALGSVGVADEASVQHQAADADNRPVA